MSASLAIVAVPNALPVWFRGQSLALTPVRLPAISGSQLEADRESTARDPGRGDAVVGQFASVGTEAESAIYLPALSGFGANDRALVAQYLSWQALSPANGQVVNYYA